jgi:hypothetical protein
VGVLQIDAETLEALEALEAVVLARIDTNY